jgi:hypothetical protein
MTNENIYNIDLQNIADYRKATRLNQAKFWQLFGCTQSGGSRYESGRELPNSLGFLLILHAQGKVTFEDLNEAARVLAMQRVQQV